MLTNHFANSIESKLLFSCRVSIKKLQLKQQKIQLQLQLQLKTTIETKTEQNQTECLVLIEISYLCFLFFYLPKIIV